MKRYLVRITESINHDYEVVAESESDAIDIVDNYTMEQLKSLDLDGERFWDRPWDVEELGEA